MKSNKKREKLFWSFVCIKKFKIKKKENYKIRESYADYNLVNLAL